MEVPLLDNFSRLIIPKRCIEPFLVVLSKPCPRKALPISMFNDPIWFKNYTRGIYNIQQWFFPTYLWFWKSIIHESFWRICNYGWNEFGWKCWWNYGNVYWIFFFRGDWANNLLLHQKGLIWICDGVTQNWNFNFLNNQLNIGLNLILNIKSLPNSKISI